MNTLTSMNQNERKDNNFYSTFIKVVSISRSTINWMKNEHIWHKLYFNSHGLLLNNATYMPYNLNYQIKDFQKQIATRNLISCSVTNSICYEIWAKAIFKKHINNEFSYELICLCSFASVVDFFIRLILVAITVDE